MGLHLVMALLLALMGLATLPLATAHAAGNAIQVENQLPGDPTWNAFSAASAYDALSGYASQASVNHGGSIDFFVTTTAQSFDIKIYRTGWYSGAGATMKKDLGVFQGVHYAVPAPDPVTGMIACNWPKTTTFTIPASWVSGVYLAKLTANTGNSSFIFFVVRDDGGHEDFVAQTSVTTYQAYNVWGGTSLYNNNLTNKALYPYAHATKVSFDRPFNPGDGNGSGHYLWYEYPFVRWAEKMGFDLTYTTNIDTATNVNPLTNHKGFLSLGHDEYWSMPMRQNVQNAINAGVNVAFLSANTCYWQIRLEPNGAGTANRVEVGYKDFAETTSAPGPDPQWKVNNSIVTSLWRDPVVGQPENTLLGVMFEDLDKPDMQPYVITNASSWVFANTGFVNGSSVPGIVGYEYDRTGVLGAGPAPAGLTVLAHSPVTGQDAGPSFSDSTIYTAASGARVFASGTIEWSYGLDNYGGRSTANAGIQQATANILYNFNGQTPAPPPSPLPSGTYLRDGFEAGNLNQWSLDSNSTGQIGPETTTVNSGTWGAMFSNSAPNSYVTTAQNLQPGAQAQTYTRFYVYIPTAMASGVATLAAGTDANGKILWVIQYDGSSKGLDIYVWDGAGNRTPLFTNQNVIKANIWAAVEIQFTETSSGGAQVWVDGTSVASATGNFATSSNYKTLKLSNDGAGTVYFDDVVVSNAYNGLVVANPTPNASLSATALTFGTQYTGTTSTAQTVTLTNTGTATLTITGIGFTGTNPGDFAQTDTCAGSLSQGASCTISVKFTPGAAGSRTANLNVSDNAASSPQSATVIGTGATPPSGMTLSSTSVDFGDQMVGSASAAQAVTLTNYDATAYTISSITLTGANAGDFTQTNTCGTSLGAGASCTINIVFAPTATGTRSATLSVADTGPASPQTAALSGNGTPPVPVASVTPNNLNLGTQVTGTTSPAQSVTLSNTGLGTLNITSVTISGANASDYAQTNTCGTSLGAGASCTISVPFTPGAKGTRSATLNVNDNASGSPQTVALTGTGSAQQLPSGVYVMDGFEGGNFSLWNGPSGPGTATVETTTVNSGTHAASMVDASGQYVSVNQDLVGGAQAVTYSRFYFSVSSGTGTTPLATGTDSGGNNLWTVLYDQGRNGLDIYLWNEARGRFDLYSNTNVVQPGTWYSVEVMLNEATAGQGQVWLNGVSIGTASGDLSAANGFSRLYLWNQATGTVFYDDVKVANAYNGPVGGAPAPAVSLSPPSLSFGNQNAGTTSAAKTVTLTNTGTATLNITSIALAGANAGDYAQTSTCGTSLTANASCTISVTFTPSASGNRSASVQLTDNAVASPQSVALSGTGVAPGVQINPASLTFASQLTGTTSARQTVTLSNTGTATLTINGITVTGTNASDFAQTNTCGASVAAGGSCTISVTFTPSSAGARSASVSISDSVAGSPQTVALTGTGAAPPPPSGTYLQDGFETANLAGWSGPNGPGQVAAQTTTVHSGAEAAVITDASGQYASLNQNLANTPGALTYTRFYFYLPTGSQTTPIAAGMDASGNNMWVMLYDQGRQGLDTYVWNGARARFDLYSNTNVLTYNTWYAVEIEMNEVSAGHAEVWVNGTSLAAGDADLSAASTYTKLSLQNQATGSIYFDDVRVANAPNGLVASMSLQLAQTPSGPSAPSGPTAAVMPKALVVPM